MLRQILTGLLRTIVPSLWGSCIAWLIGVLPTLAPLQGQLTGLADLALPVITAVIIGAWYALWRWLQPRLPDWLVRAVLGSAKTPVYPTATVTGSQIPNVNPPATLFQSHDGKHEA